MRGTTPVSDSRPGSSLSRRDSHGSTNQLRRKDSSGASAVTKRRDSTDHATVTRRDSSRRDSSDHAPVTRRDSDAKSNKRDSLHEDFRRLSFGSSLYLRPDSTGATNLIRRDSYGHKDAVNGKSRVPRDYVSKNIDLKKLECYPETGSILRRSSDANHDDKDDGKLTAVNLSKHVTILEKDGRRDSDSGLSSYLASRRMSVDSLDARRNSRRGSAASGDIKLSTLGGTESEVRSQ